MASLNGPESKDSKTLYVGNLSNDVTEDLLLSIFGNVARCTSCKIKRDTGSDPYAFIDFHSHGDAALARGSFNNINMFGKEMKVNWATSGGTQKPGEPGVPGMDYGRPGPKKPVSTEDHHHVFVGDLGQDIEQKHLWEAFAAFGEVSDVKIITDPTSQKSKGYGFVSFVKKNEAEKAIVGMNNQWLGSRAIRTNWATRKPPAPNQKEHQMKQPTVQPKSYKDVLDAAPSTNTTVYAGGFDKGASLDENYIHEHFAEFGDILEVRLFKDKGYAFIRYSEHDQAAQAICTMHGKVVETSHIKCSWGREAGDPNNIANQQQQQVDFANQMGYGGGGYGGGYGGYQWGYQQNYGGYGGYNQMMGGYQGYGGYGGGYGGYGDYPPPGE